MMTDRIVETNTVISRLRDGVSCDDSQGKRCRMMEARSGCTCAMAADEIERLRAALESCESWVDRWTTHAGNCEGGDRCTCGRAAVLYEAGVALRGLNEQLGGTE